MTTVYIKRRDKQYTETLTIDIPQLDFNEEAFGKLPCKYLGQTMWNVFKKLPLDIILSNFGLRIINSNILFNCHNYYDYAFRNVFLVTQYGPYGLPREIAEKIMDFTIMPPR